MARVSFPDDTSGKTENGREPVNEQSSLLHGKLDQEDSERVSLRSFGTGLSDGGGGPPRAPNTRSSSVRRISVTATEALEHFQATSFSEGKYVWTKSLREYAAQHYGVGQAAFLLRDAILGAATDSNEHVRSTGYHLRFNFYDSEADTWQSRVASWSRLALVSRTLHHLIQLSVWGLVLLVFFEPPNWCRRGASSGGQNDAAASCRQILGLQGEPAFLSDSEANDPDIHSKQYYPNFGLAVLTVNQSLAIELFCLLFVLFHILIRFADEGFNVRRYLYFANPSQQIDNAKAKAKDDAKDLDLDGEFEEATNIDNSGPRFIRIVQALATFILIVEMIASIVLGGSRSSAQFVRMVIFLTFSKGAQREIVTVFRFIPELLSILSVVAITVAFYAWIGVVAFYGTAEGEASFSTLVEAMWTLWICVTTANYPDVMMPAYNDNRLAVLYFVSFMVITFFFLMNVVLASVVNSYNTEMDLREEKLRHAHTANLELAFKLVDFEKTGHIKKETVMAIFLVLNEDCPDIKRIPPDVAELLFAILDKDGTNYISLEEFMNFGTVLLLEFERSESYKTFVEWVFPGVFNAPWFQNFAQRVKSSNFDSLVDAVLVFNAVVVWIQSYPELIGKKSTENPHIADGMIDTPWEVVETMFTAFYCLEMIAKLSVLGWKRYTEQLRNVFDGTITVLSLSATIYVYYPNAYSDSRLIRYIVMARVLRLGRLLAALPQFQIIGRTSFDILPAARRIFVLLFCLCYIFAAIGMQFFGGLITRDPSNDLSFRLVDTDYADAQYWANNFNDMTSGMNVLFNLLVVNNWTEMANGILAVTGWRTSRFFFLAFHICSVVVVNNLVVAFIIDSFLSEWHSNQRERKRSARGGEDAVVADTGDARITQDNRALFDASVVTGTHTGLTGQYVARLRSWEQLGGVTTGLRRSGQIREMFTRSDSS